MRACGGELIGCNTVLQAGRCLHVEVSRVLSEKYTPPPENEPWLDGNRGVCVCVNEFVFMCYSYRCVLVSCLRCLCICVFLPARPVASADHLPTTRQFVAVCQLCRSFAQQVGACIHMPCPLMS